ncbi:MAG: arginine--tRNA ligase, partial [Acidimicrobiales bacterium]
PVPPEPGPTPAAAQAGPARQPMAERLAASVAAALGELGIEDDGAGAPEVARPARLENGDFSCNVALVVAKRLGRRPRELADAIAGVLGERLPEHVERVEVAGAGFVNFYLAPSWLHEVLVDVVTAGVDAYARPDLGLSRTVNVEFVSANPTGPLHVGNGWWCAYGDALARVLERTGWEVAREYYVNDTGGQVRRLGASLLARARGQEVPEDGYPGDYVAELAKSYHGPDDVTEAGRFAAKEVLADIATTLETIGIRFNEWFSQASIEESGAVVDTLADLKGSGHVYELDGATWLRSSELGDTRDRVLVKSSGDFTYLAGDLAYHRNKLVVRGFDHAIDIFGADHQGQVASLRAGIQALGIDPSRLEVKIGQMVSVVKRFEDGTTGVVEQSKRSGNFETFSGLVADIGGDATRLLSVMSSIDQAPVLDLDLVKRASMENPVYYLQYAYARIMSIYRVAGERGVERSSLDGAELSLLVHPRELEVLRDLAELPGVVSQASVARAPYKVTVWARSLAAAFHGFYHDCYVMGEGVSSELTDARLWLVEAARIGFTIGLGLLGVSAPEHM